MPACSKRRTRSVRARWESGAAFAPALLCCCSFCKGCGELPQPLLMWGFSKSLTRVLLKKRQVGDFEGFDVYVVGKMLPNSKLWQVGSRLKLRCRRCLKQLFSLQSSDLVFCLATISDDRFSCSISHIYLLPTCINFEFEVQNSTT